jgi:hypothetical protein
VTIKKCKIYRTERGQPQASIIADLEVVLETFNASRAAYHGGDFNRVACRLIVGNAREICDRIIKIIMAKIDKKCDDATVHDETNSLQQMLGLLDAAFSYLSILHPNDEEKQKGREAVNALIRDWRKKGLSISLKAHLMEAHTYDFHEKWGVADKEESLIKQGHQIGIKDDR